MIPYHLDQTVEKLSGPTKEQLISGNQWAITALERYHRGSQANFEFEIDGTPFSAKITWDAGFSTAGMRERKDMANHGGVALAMFVMSVLLDYRYVEQTEIGEGVDYNFMKTEPNDDELNFLGEGHFVEISGILEEGHANTLKYRLQEKHRQIGRGARNKEPSSVIVTVFKKAKTVKQVHQ